MIQAMLFMLFVHLSVGIVAVSLAGSQPGLSTTLATNVAANDVVIPVTGSGVAGFPSSGGNLFIRGEELHYTATTLVCPSPYAAMPSCFTGASRPNSSAHPAGAIVRDESSGILNELSVFEQRSTTDIFGEVTSLWSQGTAIVRFMAHAATWDYPMFEGNFAILRLFGVIMSIAIGIGVFTVVANILVGAVRTVSPFS